MKRNVTGAAMNFAPKTSKQSIVRGASANRHITGRTKSTLRQPAAGLAAAVTLAKRDREKNL
jgi:hypothetical protein